MPEPEVSDVFVCTLTSMKGTIIATWNLSLNRLYGTTTGSTTTVVRRSRGSSISLPSLKSVSLRIIFAKVRTPRPCTPSMMGVSVLIGGPWAMAIWAEEKIAVARRTVSSLLVSVLRRSASSIGMLGRLHQPSLLRRRQANLEPSTVFIVSLSAG